MRSAGRFTKMFQLKFPLREAAEVRQIIEAAYLSEEKRSFVQLKD